jgi:hypothetical protein
MWVRPFKESDSVAIPIKRPFKICDLTFSILLASVTKNTHTHTYTHTFIHSFSDHEYAISNVEKKTCISRIHFDGIWNKLIGLEGFPLCLWSKES